MNLLLVEQAELGPGAIVRLADRRADHLLRVLKVHVGSTVRAGVVGSGQGRAIVEAAGVGEVQVRFTEMGEPPTPPDTDIIMAMPRPRALQRMLQTAACLGVRNLDIVAAWRVEKSYFQSPVARPDVIMRNLLLGCEQGGTTWVPVTRMHHRLIQFVDSALRDANGRQRPAVRVLPHPEAADALEDVLPRGHGGQVVAAMGPEGGWVDREVETFRSCGFIPVRLSERVLRCEIALAVLLGQLELIRRQQPRTL